MPRSTTRYQVRPRYTPGMPSLVPQHVALRVAEQEPRFYKRALSGAWGESDKAKAEKEGLDFIAFSMLERDKGWMVLDLITGKYHFWPTQTRCKKCNRLARVEQGVIQKHRARRQLNEITCDPKSYVGEPTS